MSRKYDYETIGRRSTVFSAKGVVCCSQPLASAAGLSMLQKGGNCVDAAIAVAAALNVVEPCNCGIGGDVFALYWSANEKRVQALNGSGRSPAALNLAAARSAGIKGKRIPNTSAHAITVPGAPGAWCDMYEKWGSGRLSLSEILEPAIRLAEDGFAVHPQAAYEWADDMPKLKAASKDDPTYPFLIDGEAPKPGQFFRNPDLAATFKTVAAEGKKGFYEGRIGQAITDIIKQFGGLMEPSDLSSHQTDFPEPISYTFGKEQHTVWECPPNGTGLAALIAFGIIDALRETGVVDLDSMEEGGVEWFHTLIEAMRMAFADAHSYVADPNFAKIPVTTLLSKDYLRQRAKQFSPTSAVAQYSQGEIPTGETVYFTVADKEGNAISMIMSNYIGFGSGIVPRGCGFSLQSRGAGFILEEGHPNCLEGGKRPFHTIIPAMVTQKDELFMSYGVMGASMQPQGQLQVLINILHHLHHPQKALDTPRFCIGSLALNQHESTKAFYNSKIGLEHGIKPETVEGLRQLGHDVEVIKGNEQIVFGKGQVILRMEDDRTGKRVWAAGSDPRGDGCALAEF